MEIALRAVRQQTIDQGWSRPYINRQVNRIRRMFRWGTENELVPPNVLHALCAVSPLKRGRSAPNTYPWGVTRNCQNFLKLPTK
ncbi:hypothetical protein [Gimesia maris]|uniref:hypothetical protein n=1 Tax=Gimesia maris TaxID=122 RepID=UPI0032F00266